MDENANIESNFHFQEESNFSLAIMLNQKKSCFKRNSPFKLSLVLDYNPNSTPRERESKEPPSLLIPL
ncbi:hypothetical protein SAMN04488027_10418 [Psychroflexus sediminis]|uniref:Uncharacterized protein n=1 Tax=Psychroflexus sediminis TaxID=470826 RepID=A0A1G7VNL1_9FLAO|nr:hypothetical protein SAMN04488027_10418 [Psychroflexus sediminis]